MQFLEKNKIDLLFILFHQRAKEAHLWFHEFFCLGFFNFLARSAAVCLQIFDFTEKKFFFREYPCDHYTSIINVTLMNTGCPRTQIHETALQLLQILDHRFFGCVSPLGSADDQDNDGAGRSTLNVLLSTTYSRYMVLKAVLTILKI